MLFVLRSHAGHLKGTSAVPLKTSGLSGTFPKYWVDSILGIIAGIFSLDYTLGVMSIAEAR